MVVLEKMLKVVDVFSLTVMIYYIVIGLCAFKKSNIEKDNKNFKKFACIIPARNEEIVIGYLIESLEKQNYPKGFYDVYVIPNNCTDNTETILEQKDVKIITCNDIKVNSKGDVLRYGFEVLKNEKYDAYIIFDADNVVHPDFIQKMNNMLNKGYKLVQGYRDSKNPSDSWVSSASSLHYLIQNCFINKARSNISVSSFINGTGFMISKELIEEKGYNSLTMTEDIELTVKCDLDGEKIGFANEAITYDEQPIKFGESWKQRTRWSVGTIQVLKIYSKLLKDDILKNRNFASLDSLLFLFAPYMQLLSTITFILHIVVNASKTVQVDFISKIFFVIIWYLSSVFMSIILVIINKKNIKKYIKGIFTLPFFYISWIPINVVAVVKKNLKWEKIEHTRTISFNNLSNLGYLSNGVKHEEG